MYSISAELPSQIQVDHHMESMSTAAQKGVLLLNMGTPSSPEVSAVREYLADFLSDPHVIRLPRSLRWLNPVLGRLVARFRASRSARAYRKIWTEEGSPLSVISQRQRKALEDLLPHGWRVFLAMRYGEPQVAEVLRQIRDAGITELTVVPMYPHYSGPTTHTALEEFYKAVHQVGLDISITVRAHWFDDTAYIAAQAKVITDYLNEHNLSPRETYLLFSAHSMPRSYIDRGDPYLRQIATSVVLLSRQLNWPVGHKGLSFQSKLGPVKWLAPSTDQKLQQLAQRGEKKVLVCPISFTADSLETLEEIGIRYRRQFESSGGELHLCPALNDSEPFMAALRNLVLRGPQRKPLSNRARSLVCKKSERSVKPASLYMVGVSVPNRIGSGRGPRLQYEDAETLRSVKLPGEEVSAFLYNMKREGLFEEAFVWNTCNRFECYGWIPRNGRSPDAQGVIIQTLQRVFGTHDPDELSINVLQDHQALHHVLRTTSGLNSELPGEKDVACQLLGALRVARNAGTAGPLTEALIARSIDSESALRDQTRWCEYAPSYCSALMNRFAHSAKPGWREKPITVIGRSNTAQSMLKLLIEDLGVSTEQITFVHKGHRRDGQIKQMRRLVSSGRKIRVESYDDPVVLRVVAESGLVIYGIDKPQPVLDGCLLQPMLQGRSSVPFIIDFNTFGSTANLDRIPNMVCWDAARVQHEVTSYADQMCLSESFWQAVQQVEKNLETQTSELAGLYQMDDTVFETTPESFQSEPQASNSVSIAGMEV